MIYNKVFIYADKNNGSILQCQVVDCHMDLDVKESERLFKEAHGFEGDVELLFFDIEEYNKLLKSEVETVLFINEDKKIDARYSPKMDMNTKLIYGLMDPQRPYTEEQVANIYYKDYLNTNLANCLFSNNSNIFEYKFLTLDQITLRPNIAAKNWDTYFHDPFLKSAARDKLQLGKSILEKGTYFPIQVLPNPDGYTYSIREGNHRIYSLKIAQMYDLVPEDFKILAIILPYTLFVRDGIPAHDKFLKESIPVRYNIDPVWGTGTLNDPEYLERVKLSIKNERGVFINDYTVENMINSAYEGFQSLHIYPIFLRDLFYKYPNIKPSGINTSPELFEKWATERKEQMNVIRNLQSGY